jgi:hypothetical protein
MTSHPDKYTVVGTDASGKEIRLYADGSKRNWRGQLIEKPPYAVEITSETSAAHNAMRKEKYLRAIEKHVTSVTKMNNPADAIGYIVGKKALVAMNDDTRTGNEAAKIVLQALDAYQDKVQQQVSVTRNEYVMDSATIELLEQMIDKRDENIIDATENE